MDCGRTALTARFLPRRLLRLVTEAWQDLGVRALDQAGIATRDEGYIDEFAGRAWYGARYPDYSWQAEVAGRQEALLALLRPETPLAGRENAAALIGVAMPPAAFRELVLSPVLENLWMVSGMESGEITFEIALTEQDATTLAGKRLEWRTPLIASRVPPVIF